MTATTSPIDIQRRNAALRGIRALGRAAGSLLVTIAARWNDFVDSGQLGPSADAVTSRHTGARI